MATTMAPGADLGSIEALKRVKATETDWEPVSYTHLTLPTILLV